MKINADHNQTGGQEKKEKKKTSEHLSMFYPDMDCWLPKNTAWRGGGEAFQRDTSRESAAFLSFL